jgi:hypothetical protein
MGDNRVVTPAADGSIVFRTGRRYRLLLLVQGPTDTAALRARLLSIGFVRGSVGISLPPDWDVQKPKDWPDEGLYALMSGQSLIRVSGIFGARTPVRVDLEVEVEAGAVMRLLETWDYGEAEQVSAAGAASSAIAPTGAPAKEDNGRKVLLGAAVVAGVAVGWNWLSGRRKLEREQERFEDLAAKAEKEEITRRVHELTSGGMNRYDALARAESEAEGKPDKDDEPRIIVVRA